MKAAKISFFGWQKRFVSEEACAKFPAEKRWPQDYIFLQCGHDKGYVIRTRGVYQCANCRHQVSVTAGALFHSTNLALRKWF